LKIVAYDPEKSSRERLLPMVTAAVAIASTAFKRR